MVYWLKVGQRLMEKTPSPLAGQGFPSSGVELFFNFRHRWISIAGMGALSHGKKACVCFCGLLLKRRSEWFWMFSVVKG